MIKPSPNLCRLSRQPAKFRYMLLGYARASTDDQTTRLQLEALTAAGCERIFSEKASVADRPQLAELLSHVRRGDTVIIWRVDRLGRSLRHLVEIVQSFEAAGVAFRSLSKGIDTTKPDGRHFFRIIGALGEFERELIRERTQAGLTAARARGRKGGRPRKLSADRARMARRLLSHPETTASDVAKTFGVHRSTLHKALRAGHPVAVEFKGTYRAASEFGS